MKLLILNDGEAAQLARLLKIGAERHRLNGGYSTPLWVTEIEKALADQSVDANDPLDRLDPLLLDLEQCAAILGVSEQTVTRLCRTGSLRSVKIGKLRRVLRTDLETYVNQL
jgi:excisionase family DNA binding protein